MQMQGVTQNDNKKTRKKTREVMRTQEPNVRIHNFDEVALGYTEEQAVAEAERCLNCKKKPCSSGCRWVWIFPALSN